MKELDGAYALAVIDKRDPSTLVAARMGCPLLVGLGAARTSSPPTSAIISATRRVIFLEEGDSAEVTRDGVRVFDANDAPVQREVHVSDVSLASLELGPYRHFMQKEIHEQPRAIADTIEAAIDDNAFSPELFGADAKRCWATSRRCRSRLRHQLLRRARRALLDRSHRRHPLRGRHRQRIPLPRRGRQSEAAGRHHFPVRRNPGHDGSAEIREIARAAAHAVDLQRAGKRDPARQCRLVYYTRAGAEIGVASTKAFTTQLVALFILTCTLARLRGRLDAAQEAEYLDGLRQLPGSVQHALNLEPQVAGWAEKFAPRQHALFLGRGVHYPLRWKAP